MFKKRIFDIFLALVALIIFLPLLLLISIVIKISLPGAVFFKQLRVGKGGNLFSVYKFKTMKDLPQASQGRFDAGDTSRVTSIGSVLRKYKLDELPQLLNVLRGDMSLVGPRPEIKAWTEVYPERWEIVLQVRPGITDNASIIYRNEEELLAKSVNPIETYENIILPRKLDMYISYVNNQSFLGDINILFKTIKILILK
jgi:lipopolysaccharide/colanic/teichoic acid biosynthesis glycosyltransferase